MARLVDSLLRDVDKHWNVSTKSNIHNENEMYLMVLGNVVDLFVLELPEGIVSFQIIE